ncbi:hypothetical protein GCM10025865_19360 [Paraoerskovia sediminicola]|uniref:Trehalose 6-phosphate phosphatase n=1 Tax=Paraoerskovia sediminicola TaxID=1138587 RepID=A0ABM8G3M8_9CELL|nr:trehalose-phosphatase [Paraoerskovia sediminicola]BDZ42637.1 hypothetical protein GCM10025865_19360 [Paraoerskovia sediminicola]
MSEARPVTTDGLEEVPPTPTSDDVAQLAGRRPLLVALDFDGVLAPLVDDPKASRMLPASRAALERISGIDGVQVALVSGRDLGSLADLADPPTGTLVVGSHGAETGEVTADGVVQVPLDLSPEQEEAHTDLVAGFEAAIGDLRGAWVETKPTAAVLHTRLATDEGTTQATEAADAVAARLGLEAMHGHDVVEVAVIETSKGVALTRLRADLASAHGVDDDTVAVLYAGDDTTDERAFEVLGADDLTVKVGPGRTRARRRVADPAAFAELLGSIATALDA